MEINENDHITIRAALRRLLHQHVISEEEARAAAEAFGIPPEEILR